MPITPVTGTLASVGDLVQANNLLGEPLVLIALEGSFAAFTILVEGLSSTVRSWTALASERVGASGSYPAATGIGPVNGLGQGQGTTYRVDGTNLTALRLRATAVGGGTATATIQTSPVPYGSPVANVVPLVATGEAPRSKAQTVTLATDAFATPTNPVTQPAGGPGPITPVPVAQDLLLIEARETNTLLRQLLEFLVEREFS